MCGQRGTARASQDRPAVGPIHPLEARAVRIIEHGFGRKQSCDVVAGRYMAL
jgi:hypothetical protein